MKRIKKQRKRCFEKPPQQLKLIALQELPIVEIPRSSERNTQNAVSPFRYPGGKGFLSEFLRQEIYAREIVQPICFVEPFCGGAGAALNLLADGWVGSVQLNDADIRIFSAWKAILQETERFIEAILSARLTMEEWHSKKEIASTASNSEYSFELGFAAFYMNRTTRSGIVERAGPIGGYEQTGRWKIDARFNREKLAERVKWIGARREEIAISNLDALTFIGRSIKSLDARQTLYFIDPPYVRAGGRLYYNGMTEAKHIALSDILASERIKHWILTYDDAPLIRQLYRDKRIAKISVNYSLQNKRKEKEILVLPA